MPQTLQSFLIWQFSTFMADAFRTGYYQPLYEFESEELRPTAADWLRHGLWFLVTFLSATVAGMTIPFGVFDPISRIPEPANWFEWAFFAAFVIFHYYSIVFQTVAAHPEVLITGVAFSASLLAILTAHEFGHYIAARIYKVKTTLPYFIPLPILSPAGTLGAVIKMQSPTPTQRATFDIGVAGPLAGFAVIVPIAVLGLWTMEFAPEGATAGIIFADPLLIQLLAKLMKVDLTGIMYPNPFYAAAWVGALVTSLNLLPVGQLDGGHTVYSVLGARAHYWVGRAAFLMMVALTIIGYQLYGTPGALIFTIILAVLLRIPHPEPMFDQPIDFKRKLIAVVTLVVFVLSFMPFPIQVK